MRRDQNTARIRSTTVLLVKRDGQTAMAGDGQVTLGETVIKGNARKVRRISNGNILYLKDWSQDYKWGLLNL